MLWILIRSASVSPFQWVPTIYVFIKKQEKYQYFFGWKRALSLAILQGMYSPLIENGIFVTHFFCLKLLSKSVQMIMTSLFLEFEFILPLTLVLLNKLRSHTHF